MTEESRIPSPTKWDISLARQASRTLSKSAQPGRALRLVEAGDESEMLELPPLALRLLQEVLGHLSEGRAVTVVAHRADLTIQEAADFLTVTRPYLIELIEAGKLPARKVGTRRRVALEDLMIFDQADRARRRAALDEVAKIDREHLG